MSTWAYVKAANSATQQTETKRQEEAIRTMAKLRGLEVNSAQGGGWMHEAMLDGAHVLETLKRQIQPGDTLIVASPEALGNRPSTLLANGTALAAKGVEVLVASTASELDLVAIRQYAGPFKQMERELDAVRGQLEDERREHAKEMADYAKDFEKRVTDLLAQRGIGIAALLQPKEAKPIEPKNASRGMSLREKREQLGMTQEETGKLVTPALNKTAVSRMEHDGKGDRINEYEAFLTAEVARAKRAARGNVNGQPGDPNEPLRLNG